MSREDLDGSPQIEPNLKLAQSTVPQEFRYTPGGVIKRIYQWALENPQVTAGAAMVITAVASVMALHPVGKELWPAITLGGLGLLTMAAGAKPLFSQAEADETVRRSS